MSITECQQQLDCNKASVVECFYEYQRYSFCSWNLFCFVYAHAHTLYIIQRESMKKRNLEYFPLQCDGVQFSRLLYEPYVKSQCSSSLSRLSVRIYPGMNEQSILIQQYFKPIDVGNYKGEACADLEVYLLVVVVAFFHFSSFFLVLFYEEGIILRY